jgi:hypothetical protein
MAGIWTGIFKPAFGGFRNCGLPGEQRRIGAARHPVRPHIPQDRHEATARLYAASGDGKPVTVNAGGDGGFPARGQAGNAPAGGVNNTAVRVRLAPGESRCVRFVLAWYEDSDAARSWYLGQHRDASAVADAGLASFDALKANAEGIVNRMRASNLPGWLKNQTLNTLANLSTNSMYKRDGRVAFAEGQWTCFGTMDQMWHARQIVGQMLPFFAWEELKYWARTQMKSGQIHHDTNKMDVGADRALRSAMVGWDDTEHADYRNIVKWVDLNAGFIISAYETYEATSDREQFDAIWPNVQRAAQRIVDQVDQYGNRQYPYTFDHSENSYDAGGDPNPFNDAYERQYLDRNHVFNHPLNVLPKVTKPVPVATGIRSKKQYISMPALWRNYYDIVGYHRDARSKALWLKPIVLPEMQHRMTEAMFASPDGYGTVSVTESGERFQNRELVFKPERPLEVGALHLADDFGAEVSVTVNGKKQEVTGTGTGYAKELVVAWNGTVDAAGLRITIAGSPGAAPPPLPEKSSRPAPVDSKSVAKIDPFKPIQASKASKSAGTSVEVDTTGRSCVSSVNNFDWLQFSRVDFGQGGATAISATVAGGVEGASIEVVLDDVAGDVIGSLAVPKTAGDKAWTTVTAPVRKVTGVHNVILRFSGSSQNSLMEIDKVTFAAAQDGTD